MPSLTSLTHPLSSPISALPPSSRPGSIIGKGGAKINEVRQASQCQIKISEPGEGSAGGSPLERLVTITGQPAGIQVAVRLLYDRLEQEKQKRESLHLLNEGGGKLTSGPFEQSSEDRKPLSAK